MLFADTFYWVSLINPEDEWHDRIRALTMSMDPAKILKKTGHAVPQIPQASTNSRIDLRRTP